MLQVSSGGEREIRNEKKICFITQNLFSLGGVQTVVTGAINYLLDYYDISVIMPVKKDDANPYGLSDEVRIINISQFMPKTTFIRNKRRLFYKINHNTNVFDRACMKKIVMHNCYPKAYLDAITRHINQEGYETVIAAAGDNAILLGLIANIINAKTIAWMHTTWQATFTKERSTAYGQYWIAKDVYCKHNKVLVLTYADKVSYDSEFGINSQVFYNPYFGGEHQRSPQNNKKLIWVGRFCEYSKGTDLIIEIFTKIHYEEPSWTLLIVGDGPDYDKLVSDINNNNLASSTVLLGRLSHQETMNCYAKGDIALSTSRVEGFGMTIIEAATCGVPTVAFENSGPSEIITDGENGVLVPTFDIELYVQRVLELIENKGKRKELAAAASNRARDFSGKEIMKQLISILET